MNVDIAALRAVEKEKGIEFGSLIETLETALLTAYRHTEGHAGHARVEIDRKTGEIRVWAQETGRAEGEVVREWDDTPDDFGRIAATTARQVILQRLRDVDNERTFGDFAGREHDLITGTVSGRRQGERARRGGGQPRRRGGHHPGGRAGRRGRPTRTASGCAATWCRCPAGPRGPQITLSRTHPNLVRKLFALEVPEIADGIGGDHRGRPGGRPPDEDRGAADRAGVNAKGACIGPMGARVRAVMSELNGEKIDIIDYDDDPATFVGNALSPGQGAVGRRSSTRWPGPPGSSCRTSSSRWPSARRGRTPGWPPGSPAGGSTSAATRHRTTASGRDDAGRPVTEPAVESGRPACRSDTKAVDFHVGPLVVARPPMQLPAGSPGPVRTCVGCRARERSTELLRVVAVDGVVVPDPGTASRVGGRGCIPIRDASHWRSGVGRSAGPCGSPSRSTPARSGDPGRSGDGGSIGPDRPPAPRSRRAA